MPFFFGLQMRLRGLGWESRCRSAERAFRFFCGRSQRTWSTPGVFWPWFSVTRLTARALPLIEWVSRRGQAFPFPHRPSCIALTRRAGSRHTGWRAWCPSSSDPSVLPWKDAPTGGPVVRCFSSSIVCSRVLIRKDQAEVRPFSRGLFLFFLSLPFQESVCVFRPLGPAVPLVRLAAASRWLGGPRACRVPRRDQHG